jgi:hypothetical protein
MLAPVIVNLDVVRGAEFPKDAHEDLRRAIVIHHRLAEQVRRFVQIPIERARTDLFGNDCYRCKRQGGRGSSHGMRNEMQAATSEKRKERSLMGR